MKLAELFGRAELDYPPVYGELEITKIVTDSREAVEGCLFICIDGLHTDGHRFVRDAVDAGACVIIAERVREACVGGAAACILLENTRRAAALLYDAWYGNPSKALKIVGVTGTNGKTSVSTLSYEIFEGCSIPCGLIGTVCCRSKGGRVLEPRSSDPNANLTTPDAAELYAMLAQMVADGVEYVFMEVSSHALSLEKVSAIRFELAVFTNLTRDHLDFHGDMQGYFDAKKRLFTMCRRAVLFTDDEAGRRLYEEAGCPAVRCSLKSEGDYCAQEIQNDGMSGSRYLLRTPNERIPIAIGLVGRFFIENSLLAAAVACECGIDARRIGELLRSARGARGRMERLSEVGSDFEILIDYAHTPDALEKLLLSVRELRMPKGRIVLLFGCGGERDRGKRKEMAMIASRLSDEVIVTEDNSRGEAVDQIFGDIVRGLDRNKPYRVIRDRREAIRTAVLEARAGEILILAGKGHEQYEIGSLGRMPFDERQIVAEAIRERSLRASKNDRF